MSSLLFHVNPQRSPLSNLVVLVSKTISPIIDELDPIEESYILDVCSVGGDETDE